MEITGFDSWLSEISPELAAGASIDGRWLPWLHELFERIGPASREIVLSESRAHLRAMMDSQSSWSRIADDLRTTTGRELLLRDRTDFDDSDHGWLEIEVTLDGGVLGSFGHGHSPDIEMFVAELADALCEFALDEEIWGGWPTCPDHRTHPLEAGVTEGIASWRCPTGRVVSAIGSLNDGVGRTRAGFP